MTNLTRKMSCLFVLLSLFAVNNYILGVSDADKKEPTTAPEEQQKSPSVSVKELTKTLDGKLGTNKPVEKKGFWSKRKKATTTAGSKENAQPSKFKNGLDKLGNIFSTGTNYIVGKPLEAPWLLLTKLYKITKADRAVDKVNKKMIQPSHDFFDAHLTAIKRTITLVLVIATCFYLLREDKQAAVESGKQAESETKLAQLVTQLSTIEELIENLKKEEKDSDEKQSQLNRLNTQRNEVLDVIYETYKANTPLLKRALNACRLGTFLGVAPYDEEENLIEDFETA